MNLLHRDSPSQSTFNLLSNFLYHRLHNAAVSRNCPQRRAHPAKKNFIDNHCRHKIKLRRQMLNKYGFSESSKEFTRFLSSFCCSAADTTLTKHLSASRLWRITSLHFDFKMKWNLWLPEKMKINLKIWYECRSSSLVLHLKGRGMVTWFLLSIWNWTW